jgi:hypothetical protein
VSPVIPELLETLTAILAHVSPDGPLNADAVFRNGLEAMELIDAKRFVIDNLLEGLKRGEDPATLVDRFRKLGLLSNPSATGIQPTIPSDADVPSEFIESKSMLKRWGLAVAQIVVNAIRTIPKFVEIEPSISFVLGVPALSFALKGKGMSIHELFEALRAPGRFYRGTSA